MHQEWCFYLQDMKRELLQETAWLAGARTETGVRPAAPRMAAPLDGPGGREACARNSGSAGIHAGESLLAVSRTVSEPQPLAETSRGGLSAVRPPEARIVVSSNMLA